MKQVMIKIIDEDYVDELTMCLTRQGYKVWLYDGAVCFEMEDEEVIDIDFEQKNNLFGAN